MKEARQRYILKKAMELANGASPETLKKIDRNVQSIMLGMNTLAAKIRLQ